jgi:hypothetical protein
VSVIELKTKRCIDDILELWLKTFLEIMSKTMGRIVHQDVALKPMLYFG